MNNDEQLIRDKISELNKLLNDSSMMIGCEIRGYNPWVSSAYIENLNEINILYIAHLTKVNSV